MKKKNPDSDKPMRRYSVRLDEYKAELVRDALSTRGKTLSDAVQELIDLHYENIEKQD